jgi:hypothetical protein
LPYRSSIALRYSVNTAINSLRSAQLSHFPFNHAIMTALLSDDMYGGYALSCAGRIDRQRTTATKSRLQYERPTARQPAGQSDFLICGAEIRLNFLFLKNKPPGYFDNIPNCVSNRNNYTYAPGRILRYILTHKYTEIIT